MDNVIPTQKISHTLLEDILAILIGTLMVSFGVILLRQAGALTGGTAGIAFLTHYLTNVSFGVNASQLSN
ncbi:hypothetical protein PEC301879_12660 [Pectobacterium carotovorum subsp. carotovorum]|nr:hypothetical protein PEC301879_12660 [Pectobacterium carotovorum subsp. carotovorum]